MDQKRGGARLRRWLQDERRNQEWLASQVGTSQQTLSAWIRGRPIPLAQAVSIRGITGIAIEEWLVAAEPETIEAKAS